jgi:hypothetical protein
VFKFEINDMVHHVPTETTGRVVGLYKDRNGSLLINVEYKDGNNLVTDRYFPQDEIVEKH